MATLHSIRIREDAELNGVISLGMAARKYARYGVTKSDLSRWAKNGKIAVAKWPAFPGDTILLDEGSLRKHIQKHYAPESDNRGRRTRTRSRTIPEMQAETGVLPVGSSNGHSHAAGMGGRVVPGVGVPSVPVAPGMIGPDLADSVGHIPLLDTKEYVEKFYEFQTKKIGVSIDHKPKEIKAKTKHNYDWAFSRFIPVFPTLPLEVGDRVPRARKAILKFLDNLLDARTGRPMNEHSKINLIGTVKAFYSWLSLEYGYHVPKLQGTGMKKERGQFAVPIYYDEIREVLKKGVRNHAENTFILLLAQTGARLGELCTIRPEFVGDHSVTVWGKGTGANKAGHRPLAIPDEAFKALKIHLKTYGELVWVDTRGRAKPLAGPVEAAGPWPIDLRDKDTYIVRPAPGMVDAMGATIRRIVRHAGVYQPGKVAHSFRRGFQAEYINNGGERTFMRQIMGHFSVGDMDDLYTHATVAQIVSNARKYAPRRFLQDEAELRLAGSDERPPEVGDLDEDE